MGIGTFNVGRDMDDRPISSAHYAGAMPPLTGDGGDEFSTAPQYGRERRSLYWAQFMAVYRLHFINKFRDPLLLVLPLAGVLLYSLSVAFAYFQIPYAPRHAPTVRWILVLQTVYLTATSNLAVFTTFDQDRRELLPGAGQGRVRLHFSSAAIWLGRYAAEIQLRTAYCILSAVIIYPICGLRPGFGWYLLYQLALILQALGNGAFGLNVAAFFTNHLIGARMGVAFFFFNFLFSGPLFVSRDVTWILLWLRYLSVSFYVGQILLFSQFHGAVYPNSPVTGDDILEGTGWLAQPLSVTIVGLIALTILYNVTGIFGLWLSTRHSYVDTNK